VITNAAAGVSNSFWVFFAAEKIFDVHQLFDAELGQIVVRRALSRRDSPRGHDNERGRRAQRATRPPFVG
jgi:hypothetical protein